MSGLSNEQILSNIYYDLERGYGSAKSLYEQAKEEGAVYVYVCVIGYTCHEKKVK